MLKAAFELNDTPAVKRTEHRASCMLGECSTPELLLQDKADDLLAKHNKARLKYSVCKYIYIYLVWA